MYAVLVFLPPFTGNPEVQSVFMLVHVGFLKFEGADGSSPLRVNEMGQVVVERKG